MLKQFVLFAIWIAVVVSEDINVVTCGSNTHLPVKVQFSNCPSQPCEFKHGQTVDVKITFVAQADETKLTAAIHGIVLGFHINWPMPNSDGCKDQGITCPIKKGQTYTYHSSFKVLDIYPKIRLPVQWELNGGANQFCMKFPMAIVDGVAEPSIG